MRDPNKEEFLDQLLDETLKALPKKQAPSDFLQHVMMRVEEEAATEKAVNPVLRWAFSGIGFLFAGVLSYYGHDVLLILRNMFGIKDLEKNVGFLARFFDALGSIGDALLTGLSSISPVYLMGGILAVAFVLFTSCLSLGTVLYRLSEFSNLRFYQN